MTLGGGSRGSHSHLRPIERLEVPARLHGALQGDVRGVPERVCVLLVVLPAVEISISRVFIGRLLTTVNVKKC